MPEAKTRPASQGQVLLALLAVYFIWGSTYLAIRFAVATLPPFLMLGFRFLVAGSLLFGWLRLRGAPLPKLIHWRSAAIVGALLLVGGNGIVGWAEQVVPSSLVALIIAMTPIWMTLIDWMRPGGVRPTLPVSFGLLLGFIGVALLIGPNLFTGTHALNAFIFIIPCSSLSWAIGSVYSRSARMPSSPLMGTSIEMLSGGVLLVILGLVTGETNQVHVHSVSTQSVLALLYLIVFGSLIAFTAYVWLLRNTTLARASTYAYVNPVIAVLLGWGFAGESLTPLTLLAAALIVGAIVIVVTMRSTGATLPQADLEPVEEVTIVST